MIQASRRVQFTVGFASVPYQARQDVIRLWEDAKEQGAQNWIVLDSLAADLIITSSDSAIAPQNYQVVARLANGVDEASARPANDDGPLILQMPITLAGLHALLDAASCRLRDRGPSRKRAALTVSRGKDLDALMKGAAVRTSLPEPNASPAFESPTQAEPTTWEHLALSLYAIQHGPRDARILLELGEASAATPGEPAMAAIADFQARSFTCTAPARALRDHSGASMRMQTLPPPFAAPVPGPFANALRDTPAMPLEVLLWIVGVRAFSGRLAPWLQTRTAYGLARWPDFTKLPHGMEDLLLTALLANGHYTPAALVKAARLEPARVADALNAFSLMGLLDGRRPPAAPESAAPAPAPSLQAPVPSPAAPKPTKNLFSRLWSKLGL